MNLKAMLRIYFVKHDNGLLVQVDRRRNDLATLDRSGVRRLGLRAVAIREPARNFAHRDAVQVYVAVMDRCAHLGHLGC
jgi:hypothetical protein